MGRGAAPEIQSRPTVNIQGAPYVIAIGFATAVAIAVAGVPAGATTPYADARTALAQGRADQAASLAEALLAEGPDAATYELLSLAELRRGRRAEAVWALRNAAALGGAPPSPALAEAVYADLPPGLRPLPRRGLPALAAWGMRVGGPNAAALLALVASLLAGGVLARRVLRPRTGASGPVAGAALLAVAALCLYVAFRQNRMGHPREAVVVEEAVLREAPADGAPELEALPAGAVVATGEELSGYTAVVLPTGRRGWLRGDVLRAVAPLGTLGE